ncbi:MAG: ABC transporter substrate-binding protein [Commensalibacter sp.]
MKMKPILFFCSLASIIGTVSFAQISLAASNLPNSAAPAVNNDKQAIKQPVVLLYQTLNHIQQPNSGTSEQRAALLLPVLQKSYDIPTVLANTVGYRYNSFSDTEKQQLAQVFERFTVSRYLSNFTPDASAKFEILPDVKPAPVGTDQIVSTKIGAANDFASATEVNYLVRNTPQGWKIVDVLLNGHISQVALQHVDFSASLANGGIQKLTDMLNQKIASSTDNK